MGPHRILVHSPRFDDLAGLLQRPEPSAEADTPLECPLNDSMYGLAPFYELAAGVSADATRSRPSALAR